MALSLLLRRSAAGGSADSRFGHALRSLGFDGRLRCRVAPLGRRARFWTSPRRLAHLVRFAAGAPASSSFGFARPVCGAALPSGPASSPRFVRCSCAFGFRADAAAPSARPAHGACRSRTRLGHSSPQDVTKPSCARMSHPGCFCAVQWKKERFGESRKRAWNRTRSASGANSGRLSTCPLPSAIKRSALASVPVLPRAPSSRP